MLEEACQTIVLHVAGSDTCEFSFQNRACFTLLDLLLVNSAKVASRILSSNHASRCFNKLQVNSRDTCKDPVKYRASAPTTPRYCPGAQATQALAPWGATALAKQGWQRAEPLVGLKVLFGQAVQPVAHPTCLPRQHMHWGGRRDRRVPGTRCTHAGRLFK